MAQLSTAFAQGTAFTYQGLLNNSNGPANGSYDLTFTLYGISSGGSAVVGPVTNSAIAVSNGLFTATIDFGAGVFNGTTYWLELGGGTNGSGTFATLAPRQKITPTLYAIMAGSASNLVGTFPAAQLTGSVGNSQLANNSITVSAGAGLSGGGAVALGGSTTLNNAGVLSVTGSADITASSSSGAVTLGSTATNANTANAIVKRDANGNFSAGNITLAGTLDLPATTSTSGIINSGGIPFIHAYGSGNLFAGAQAGNFTMSGGERRNW